MKSSKKDKVITVRLTKKHIQKLKKFSRRSGLTQSQIVRRLISEKLKHVR